MKTSRDILFSPALEVTTNAHISRWFKYGSCTFAEGKIQQGLPDRVKAQYVEGRFRRGDIPKRSESQVFYWARGIPGADEVFVLKELPVGIAVLVISGIARGSPTVRYNALYDFWSTLRFTKYPRAVQHLAELVEVDLLLKGITPLHCSCVLQGDYAHLILAPPDVGKTLTATMLAREGLGYGGEDISLVRKERVIPVPFTTTVIRRARRPFYEAPLGLVWQGADRKYTVYEALQMAWQPLLPEYRLGNLYILQHSERNRLVGLTDREPTVRMLIGWNHIEFGYARNKVVNILLGLNRSLPMPGELALVEAEGVAATVRGAQEVFVAEGSEPGRFWQTIKRSLM